MIFRKTTFSALVAAAIAAGAVLAEPPAKSVSSSRQFIIFGADIYLRGAVARLAEQTKADVLRFLQLRDEWKTPILVDLQLPQPNVPDVPPVALNFSQTGFGLKLQLNLLVGPDIEPIVVQREILRATLLELSYRGFSDIPPGQTYIAPPDWLLEGLLVVTANKAPLTETLQTAVNGGRVASLREVILQRRNLLDGESRTLFRAYSYAAVEMLSAQPDGHAKLARFVADLPRASSDPLADLCAHFPALKDDVAAEKSWQADVRRIALRQNGGMQTFIATERALDKLLNAPIADSHEAKNPLVLRDCAQPRARFKPRAQEAVTLEQQLALLESRAHPLLRAVVSEIQKCVGLAKRSKNRELVQRFARATSERIAIDRRMSELDDYLNWFEATQVKTSSGAFANYLHAAGLDHAPSRHDALSVYLDTVEQQLE